MEGGEWAGGMGESFSKMVCPNKKNVILRDDPSQKFCLSEKVLLKGGPSQSLVHSRIENDQTWVRLVAGKGGAGG